MRHVRRLSAETAAGQGELFTAWRYRTLFTDSPFETLQTELQHRQHATIEQVIADGKGSAPAHPPSGDFQANAARLTLRAIAHNLLRAADALTGAFHAKATTATIRTHLVHIPARLARTARRLTLHPPTRRPWQHAFTRLFHAVHPPPTR
ncbi:transposase [Kitasatospora sp. YST-16]|uniref:transposase n=1 Tax=Kitasatospora sp. YST-16 TaxID=2998080 RepID=UPI00228418B8|nr:transposase [Kitasatospora sp. YST-16]WAL74688.1 transposase [Kitasatospora sp. YST-16]